MSSLSNRCFDAHKVTHQLPDHPEAHCYIFHNNQPEILNAFIFQNFHHECSLNSYGANSVFFHVTHEHWLDQRQGDCGRYWGTDYYGKVVVGRPNHYINDYFNRNRVSGMSREKIILYSYFRQVNVSQLLLRGCDRIVEIVTTKSEKKAAVASNLPA